MLRSSFALADSLSWYATTLVESREPAKKIVGIALHWGTLPVALIAVPFTITADIIVGLFEAARNTYREGFNEKTCEILYTKTLVSPIRQTLFVLGAAPYVIAGLAAAILLYLPTPPATQAKSALIAKIGRIACAVFLYIAPCVASNLGRLLSNISVIPSSFSILYKVNPCLIFKKEETA